jgi:thiol-disulfide isomerase/thioredoxin
MKNKILSFLLIVVAILNFNSQTFLTIKNCPINSSPNPTISVYNFFSGETKSYWNKESDQKFIIPTNNSNFTNVVIHAEDGNSKSFFIRKNDSVTYDYQKKEIINSKFGYSKDDFKLTQISNSDDWKKTISNWNISDDFITIIELQSKINEFTFKNIPKDLPKGLPAYRNKLYQYLKSKYELETKRTANNGIYLDYLDYFTKIYNDTSIDKKNLSQIVFADLNAMATATTKDDFIKAFELYKNKTTDEDAVLYIQNEYFLDDKIIDKKEIGLINFKKEQISFKDILSKNREKYTVVDFWASWCAPCILSLPKSKELESKFSKNVEFIYLSLDKSYNPWQKAVEKFNLTNDKSFLIVNGANKNLQINDVKIQEIPRYFIYDQNGKLINSDYENISEVERFLLKNITNQ